MDKIKGYIGGGCFEHSDVYIFDFEKTRRYVYFLG